jgi:hypothetical protein
MMFILYFGNFFQAIFLYYATTEICYMFRKPYSLQYCFRYSMYFNTFWSLSVISWIILILSTWNSIRCQRNFGMNLGFYRKQISFTNYWKSIKYINNSFNRLFLILTVRYEPTPDVFKSGRKLKKREYNV